MPSKVDPVPVAFQDYFWLVGWWWRVVDVWLRTEVLGPVRRVRESPGTLKAIDGPLIRRDSVWSAGGFLATGGVEIRETKDFPRINDVGRGESRDLQVEGLYANNIRDIVALWRRASFLLASLFNLASLLEWGMNQYTINTYHRHLHHTKTNEHV
jgi:hypothetical protein